MGFEGLNDLLTKMINDESINVGTVYNVIFDNGTRVPSGMNKAELSGCVTKLSACFDLNGDGTYSTADLEYLKKMDMLTIMKIINGATSIVHLLKELAKINIDRATFIDLTFRMIVYATLLPMAEHCAEFRVWAKEGNNKTLLVESISVFHNMIESSDIIGNAVDGILAAIKSRCTCCLSAPKPSIQEIQTNINTNISLATASVQNRS